MSDANSSDVGYKVVWGLSELADAVDSDITTFMLHEVKAVAELAARLSVRSIKEYERRTDLEEQVRFGARP